MKNFLLSVDNLCKQFGPRLAKLISRQQKLLVARKGLFEFSGFPALTTDGEDWRAGEEEAGIAAAATVSAVPDSADPQSISSTCTGNYDTTALSNSWCSTRFSRPSVNIQHLYR